MTTLAARVRSLWRNLRHRSSLEQALDEELQAHLEHRADDLVSRGMNRREALRTARLEFGSIERVKEEARQSVGLRLFDELRGDVRYAWRVLRHNKAFAATALATLALTIGANTAVFSAIDALLLRPLPVHRPEQLVAFEWLRQPDVMVAAYSGYGRPGPGGAGLRTSFAAPTFAAFSQQHEAFSEVFAFAAAGPVNVTAPTGSEPASGLYVSGTYFRGLGVTAQAGRVLVPADDQPQAPPVAVISDRYWRSRFAADPGIVGQTITVNRLPVTLVGVSAPGFDGPELAQAVEITLPLSLSTPLSPSGRDRPPSAWWLQMMGRLRPGVTRQQALSAVTPLFVQTVRESWDARPPDTPNPSRSRIPELRVSPGAQGPSGSRLDFGQLLIPGGGVVVAVLLIGCLNLANLLLVRGAARRREIAMRLTLGATRWRIARQLMTETLLLALLGGLGGLVVAWWLRGFLGWLPLPTPPIVDARIDLRVLLFTLLLSTVTSLAFGLGPSMSATRATLEPRGLERSGGRVTRGVGSRALLVAQLALSLALIVATALLVRTIQNFGGVDLGFNADNLLVFRTDLGSRSREARSARELLERITAAIEALPGVRAVTMSAIVPVSRNNWDEGVVASGMTASQSAAVNVVRFNFLSAMGVPLLAGRDLSDSDIGGHPLVAVVSETFARQIFGEATAVGRYFEFTSGTERGKSIQVVGITRDMKYSRLDEAPPASVFLPEAQASVVRSRMNVEVKTSGAPAAIAAAVQAAVRQIDPMIPVTEIKTQRQVIAETIGRQRSLAALLAAAGLVGLLLACIGLYGVVSYDTISRVREIGIRLALGARRFDVLRLVMQRSVTLVVVGAGLGVGLALAASKLIAGALYGIAPSDPVAITVAVAILVSAALAAAFLPARRAVRLHPTEALRYE